MNEHQTVDIGDECVMCYFYRDMGCPPSIEHIINGEEPWPDTCKIHLDILDSMRKIFGAKQV